MKKVSMILVVGVLLAFNSGVQAVTMEWVTISEAGFTGQMSKYETTNAQYCQFLNAALASGDITVSGNDAIGANGSNSGADYAGQLYYDGDGTGWTGDGANNGGAVRINYSSGVFSVDSGFETHPVTYVSWYGAAAFSDYYGYRLPTEDEWQAIADYDGSYIYGSGTTINNSMANYFGSDHPDGTTEVGHFGTYGYGMADMSGNVWEWTSSISIYGGGGSYVTRGGAWDCSGDFDVEVIDNEDYALPGLTACGGGFRVARDSEPAGPVAYWSFDDLANPGHDDSGNGNNGIVNGTVSADGICGKALNFDGQNDYVDVPDAPDLNPTSAITITAWFKADSFALGTYSWPHIVDKSGNPDPTGYFMAIVQVYQNNPCVGFAVEPVGGVPAGSDLGVPILTPGNWYFSAGVYDGSALTVYVGSAEQLPLVATSANYSGNIVPSSNNLNIGRDASYPSSTNRFFHGAIDEVRIYDRALSVVEIEDLYATCEPADPVELLVDLAQDVIALNLQQGISNSLDSKLQAAMQALDDINENNDVAAINTLQAFINAVEAQRGNKVSEADADAIIASAQEIIELLSME